MIRTFNCDNMEFMANVPDKFYDLAIVDPPYGINVAKMAYTQSVGREVMQKNGGKLKVNNLGYKHGEWDKHIPSEMYFTELFRVSKNHIIWGANYFGLVGGMIVWDKLNGDNSFSDAEIAYCSYINKVEVVYYMWSGMCQGDICSKDIIKAKNQIGDKSLNQKRIHPTEKPIKLYKWLLNNYAKEGDKILDTHGGSGSIMIACHDMHFDLDWIELDNDYYNAAIQRLEQHKKQLKLF